MDTPVKKRKRDSSCGISYTNTPTTQRLTQDITEFLPSRLPLCLMGPPASGKTSLLQQLAAQQGASLSSVYIDSSIDSKSLLGAYISTEVPGEFMWKPGVLTSAVELGHWIVFEQLQDVPMEIMTLLIDLSETHSLHLPQKNKTISVPQGFRLFATASIAPGHKLYDYIHDKWVVMRVEELPHEEWRNIAEGCWPLVGEECVMNKAWEVFRKLKDIPGRPLYLRDWLKFTHRLHTLILNSHGPTGIRNGYLTEHLQEQTAYEAFELLCSGRSAGAVSVFTELLGVSQTSFGKHYSEYRPEFEVKPEGTRIGRARGVSTVEAKSGMVHTAYTLRLLERLAVALSHAESLLLVGETGCGKTSIIQHLSQLYGVKLHVHNLSQMSDPVDLIGGFRPMDVKHLLEPVIEQFLQLFPSFLSATANAKFLDQVRRAYADRDVDRAIQYLSTTIDQIMERVSGGGKKYDHEKVATLQRLQARLQLIEKQHQSGAFLFSFVEGSLVQALKRGEWLLLEEINLAGEEVLERLHTVLEGGSITLVEKGDTVEVHRDPRFRLFGCMNPGRSAGKKDLALPIRLKFTELFVAEMTHRSDISEVVSAGLGGLAASSTIESIVDLYLAAREAAESGSLEDGRGRPPQFSLRTLCRSLEYARTAASVYSFPVGLFNGLLVYFCSQLSASSAGVLEKFLAKLRPVSVRQPRAPGADYVSVEGFWVQTGPLPCVTDPMYILTPAIRGNLQAIARCMVTNTAILLEGPTSVGKTSLVEYLAKVTGHRFIRINNHQHTDVDEYIGSYVTTSSGKLAFKEGILVEALRNGYFVVLDELNLAPSEVLEALNRLLDDNRELFIPETNTVVKPHPQFRLFATQNPTAGYAGRKELSKAFRNRFVEMYIAALPDAEIEQILCTRCKLAPSFSKVLLQVQRNLQVRRTSSHAFTGREGFITMRDLLKIANKSPASYDELGAACFVVLGERLRTAEEKRVLVEVLKGCTKNLTLDIGKFYEQYCATQSFTHDSARLDLIMATCPPQGLADFAWNRNMRRLYTLIDIALTNNEPVLLVGETGCGKTTICQVLAALRDKRLRTINCHQHSETSDFLGGLRPVRNRPAMVKSVLLALKDAAGQVPGLSAILQDNSISPEEKLARVRSAFPELPEGLISEIRKTDKIFEWADGPLLESMREGSFLLIDEISLADESVLERLNSVLEADRKLLVPEKGGEWSEEVTSTPGFQLLATMNPGGDYGKKELSPALRNRFTEIWVSIDSHDMRDVIQSRIPTPAVDIIITFVEWYNAWARVPISLRDVTCWADFVKTLAQGTEQRESLWHGACFTFLDSISDVSARQNATAHLCTMLGDFHPKIEPELINTEGNFGLWPFLIDRRANNAVHYSFAGPTVTRNLFRLLRALQLPKPILLEGSPGVGKTSIIESLSQAIGHPCVRINLSEETDLMDLLGSDLPIGDAFEWCDGPLLSAMKAGSWVILDELNLCPQPVIEGLNAVLDHRGTVFLPDLGREVVCQAGFRVFAAQNPLSQGGGRKGLPKSFLNRFSRINVEQLSETDYRLIADALFVGDTEMTQKMVRFNAKISSQSELTKLWEFNLRDILRWMAGASPQLLYYHRMRDPAKRAEIDQLYASEFGHPLTVPEIPYFRIYPGQRVHVGNTVIQGKARVCADRVEIVPKNLAVLEQLGVCVDKGWPVLITGPASVGKASVCRLAAALYSVTLHEYSLSSGTDSSDLIGSYEQTDQGRFCWTDSTLVSAISTGSWVLLKHANLCPPSVLDRINSLLEPNGFLMLNEKGSAEANIVTPHKDFRVFFTCDPKYGEVSRALRNRCVEIAVLGQFSVFDVYRLGQGLATLPVGVQPGAGLSPYAKYAQMAETGVQRRLCCSLALGKELEQGESLEVPKFATLSELMNDPITADMKEDISVAKVVGAEKVGTAFVVERGSAEDMDARLAALSASPELMQAVRLLLSVLTSSGLLPDPLSPMYQEHSPNCPLLSPTFIHWFLLSVLEDPKLTLLLPSNSEEIWATCYFSSFSSSELSWGKAKARIKRLSGRNEIKLPENYLKLKGFKQVWKRRLAAMSREKPILAPYGDVDISALTTISYPTDDFEIAEMTLVKDEKDVNLLKNLAWNRIKPLLIPSFLSHLCTALLTPTESLPLFPCNYPYLSLLSSLYEEYRRTGSPGLLQRLTFECLREIVRPKAEFSEFFTAANETSLSDLPIFWASLELIRAWPMQKYEPKVSSQYLESLKTDLGIAGNPLELGLRLYEWYRTVPADPICSYAAELHDTSEFLSKLRSNICERQQIEQWKYAGLYSTDLYSSYAKALSTHSKRESALQTKLIRDPQSSDSLFVQHCQRLPSESRLAMLVAARESAEKRTYAIKLLEGLIEGLEAYLPVCADLAVPMMEALLLIRAEFSGQSLKGESVEFPIALETALESESLPLLCFAAHCQSSVSDSFSRVIAKTLKTVRATLQAQPQQTLKLHLPKYVSPM